MVLPKKTLVRKTRFPIFTTLSVVDKKDSVFIVIMNYYKDNEYDDNESGQ